jgi:hypothetical protein
VTGLVVHVSENLSTSNSDTIGTGKDCLGDMTTELETGRHVGEETSLVGQVNELEGMLKLELKDLRVSRLHHVMLTETYDTLGRVTVGSTIKGNLVKATQSSKLDTPSSNSDVVGDDWVVTLGIGFGEIIDKRSVEVECRRKDLLVVPQDMTGQSSHVSNSLGSG